MAPLQSKERRMQPTVKDGMGEHFSSPPKKRNSKRKTQTPAFTTFDHEAKKRKLQDKLKSFVEGSSQALNPSLPAEMSEVKRQEHVIPASTDFLKENQSTNNSDHPELAGGDATDNKKRRTAPNQSAHNLHTKWTQLIPSLIDDFLEYSKLAIGKAESIAPSELKCRCSHPQSCQYKYCKIICLYFDRKNPAAQCNCYESDLLFLDFKNVTVTSCNCDSTSQILVRNGLFPTSPSQTRFSVSIALLDFYAALFERSCDAVNALATALNNFYIRRGFFLVNKQESVGYLFIWKISRPLCIEFIQNQRYKDPFRRSLGYAIQWFDVMRVEIENRVQSSLSVADHALTAEKVSYLRTLES